MTINNWDGNITKEMFDLSQVESNYQTFITQTRKYLTNCLIGSAHLTGEGSLLEYFEDIIEEIVERGMIAIIEVGKEKLLAIPEIKKQNLAKEELIIEFTLLDNSEQKFTNQEISKWVIFKFNSQGTSHLSGLDFWTKRLANLLNKMERDLVISEKGIMFTLPEWPDDGDVQLITKSFNKKPFFFICFPNSAKANPKEGKQGIAPHQVKTEFYEPKTDQRAFMIRDFKFCWTNMERAFGIRHDALEGKEERASVSEVFSSQANFDAFEKKIYRLLWKSIREYNRVFEDGKGNYQFKYGRIGN